MEDFLESIVSHSRSALSKARGLGHSLTLGAPLVIGPLEAAEKLLADVFELPDLCEGDSVLADLWHELMTRQRARHTPQSVSRYPYGANAESVSDSQESSVSTTASEVPPT